MGSPGAITAIKPRAEPFSLETSDVSIEPARDLLAGEAARFVLTLRTASGTPAFATGLKVAFSVDGGTSAGDLDAVVENSDGTYSANFVAVTAGTPATVFATVGGLPVNGAAPSFAVLPGTFDGANSLLSSSAERIASGAETLITFKARDAAGNQLTSGGLSLAFGSEGESTGSFSVANDLGDGTYTAIFTGARAGAAATIAALVDGVAQPPTVEVIVTPGAVDLAHSSLAVANSALQSGDSQEVTLTLRDASDNVVADSGATVSFLLTGGDSTADFGAAVDHQDGTISASLTGVRSGTASQLGAMVNGQPLTSSSPSVTVQPGPVSVAHCSVAAGSTTVISGNTTPVTVSVRDAAGNRLATGVTVSLSASGGTSAGTFGSVSYLGGSDYRATFSGTTSGSATTVRATVNGVVIPATVALAVAPSAPHAAHSLIGTAAPTVSSGSSTTVTLTAMDAAGNRVLTGGVTVVFSLSGGTSAGTFASVVDHNDGTYTASFTGTTAGTAATVRAQIAGVNVSTSLPTITVNPGAVSVAQSTLDLAASSVASGAGVVATLTAKDSNGNRLTTGGSSVSFAATGGTSTGTFGATSDHSDGTYTATFTGVLAGSATTITSSIGGAPVTSTLPSVSVTPGAATPAQSIVTAAASTVLSGASVSLTLIAKDAAGNLLSTGGLTVAFSASGGSSDGSISAVTDHGDGTYTASFTGSTAGSATTIAATIDGSAVTSTTDLTVTPGAFSLSLSTVTLGTTSLASGSATTVTLVARDAAGNQHTTGGLTVAFGIGGGASSGTLSSVTDQGNGTYTATLTATTAGSASSMSATIGGTNVTSSMPSLTVSPGAASLAQSVVTRSDASIASGSAATVTLTARDAYANQLTTGGLSVAFSASGGTSTGTFGSVTDHGNGTYSASWTGVLKGSARTIGATIGGGAVTSALPTIAVTQGPMSLARSSVSVSASSVAAGSGIAVTLTEKDAAGNIATAGGLTVALGHAGGTSTGVFDPLDDNGDGTYTTTFTGETAGTATTLTATIDGSAVTSTMPTVSVTPGVYDLSQSTLTASAGTVVSGNTLTLTLTARDSYGNQLTTGGSTVVFSSSGGTSGVTLGATNDLGNGTYTSILTGTVAGTATQLQATIDGTLLLSAFPSATVEVGAISVSGSVVSVGSSSIQSGNSTILTLTARDAAGNEITSGGATVTFGFSGGVSTGTIGATTDNGDGTYTATFTGITAGIATTITCQINGSAVTSTLPTLAVVPASTRIVVVSGYPSTTTAGDPHSFTVTIQDTNNNVITDYAGTVSFSSVDLAALLPSSYDFQPSDFGTAAFLATFKTAGTHDLTAVDVDDATLTGQQTGIAVSASVADKLGISGPTTAKAGVCSSAFAINILDTFGNVTTSAETITVNLGASGGGGGAPAFYTDSECATVATSVDIVSGESNALIYVKDSDAEGVTLSASDAAANLEAASPLAVTINPYQAWIGATPSNNAFETGATAARGRFDAQMSAPNGSALDANGYLYVVDSANARILKYDTNDSNAFIGWTGKVGSPPTGGAAGCSSTAVNAATPGWCTGGYAVGGTGTGHLSTSAAGAYVYDSYLYVLDVANTRVTRWDVETGVMDGWVGKILTTTGMSGDCLAAGVGAATPTWCTGGTGATTSGTGNGMLSTTARSITGDGTYLYVSDAGNHRIMRWDMATGAFAGWLGKIATAATSPAACSSAAAGVFTPDWCFGGTAASGTGNGMMNAPRGLAVDGTYLYVADTGNFRVQRLSASNGAFAGWIGRVNSATGMANYSGLSGCTAAANSPTSCWVTGGTAKTATAGMNGNQFSAPYGLAVSGGNFYVADGSGHRLTKHGANGAYVGAVGRIASTTNMGPSACTSAGVNSYAPTWCTNSSAAQVSFAQTGGTGGMLNTPLAATGDDSYVYVSDTSNNRIARFDADTGAYAGFLGASSTISSSWSTESPSQTLLSGRGDGDVYLPTGVAFGSSAMYVVDSTNHRVKRYDSATGAFTGWIGAIWTPPTGGAVGCAGAGGSASATFTPGWCTGGNAKTGTGNGMLNTPQGIYADGAYLYVVDQSNHRISKYNESTGAFVGWIGKISSVTGLGGAAGCSSATTGTFTPGWCTGGTAASGTGNGMLNTPQGIDGDGTYLYVADGTNHRVSRYMASTGAFAGWIGKIATSPTGGSSDACNGAAVGSFTPGWCTGGTAATGTGTGHLATPRGIAYSSSAYLYVTDANHRISRFDAATGAFGGWLGKIATVTGLGGASGCASAIAGAFTPGWCTGGTSSSGTGNGMLSSPKGIWGNGTNLWVVDVTNNRIAKYNESTGAFVGWSGAVSSTASLGGATGCSTTLAGAMTPGWCTGGTAKRSTVLGTYDAPAYMKGNGAQYLYVTDGNNMRIGRLPQ